MTSEQITITYVLVGAALYGANQGIKAKKDRAEPPEVIAELLGHCALWPIIIAFRVTRCVFTCLAGLCDH